MADPYGYISFNNQNQSVSPNVSPIAGNAIGIIAVNLDYPKLPGNVANATTFTFPVDYEVIDLEIEQLFENDPAAIDVIVNAAKRLEARGVKAIVGACGYFANFQHQVQASSGKCAGSGYSLQSCATAINLTQPASRSKNRRPGR